MTRPHSSKCFELGQDRGLCAGAITYEAILNRIEEVVDKIRYAGDSASEAIYVKELLSLFAADSGRFIGQLKK